MPPGEIWQQCSGHKQLGMAGGWLHRIVESQQQIATLGLVDSLAEQQLLEELIDGAKPAVKPLTNGRNETLHYLLSTTFRYPPLNWGSRFGRPFEPSLLYGASTLPTGLAEVAYYRLVFLAGMSTPPPVGRIRSEHSAFCVRYRSEAAVRLQNMPFAKFSDQLQHPSDYSATQQLGSDMRNAGVLLFEYQSARYQNTATSSDTEIGMNKQKNHGICAAMFTPEPLLDHEPQQLSEWLCETRAESVAFRRKQQRGEVYEFSADQFFENGKIPSPA